MILTDFRRRWAEIRFYCFCLDIYKVTKSMLDVVYAVEAIAQLGTFKITIIKNIAGKMLSDPYYMPVENEVIVGAHRTGYSLTFIANYMSKTKSNTSHIIKRNQDKYAFVPKCEIDEDAQLVKFMDLVDRLKKAGI